jgi:hypothetical protein
LAGGRCDIGGHGRCESIKRKFGQLLQKSDDPGVARTCQTKGRLFRFASASRIATILHIPPGALKPVHLDRVAMSVARNVGCEARAATEAPATTMLTACAIVTIPRKMTE